MDSRSIHPTRPKRTPAVILAALALSLGCVTGGTSVPVARAAEREVAVDSACAWGRLADGKGRLLRCLTADEARRLRGSEAPPAAADAPTPKPTTETGPGTSTAPVAPPVAGGTPPAPPPPEAPATPAPPPEAEPSPLAAEVGSVTPDEGALPDALKGLRKALDRYAECVDKNGGLTAERGEAEIRFLVRGRGRAEGVSVKKRRGITEAAAKCIADVIDRRYVGYPEAEAVGATAVVGITKKKR